METIRRGEIGAYQNVQRNCIEIRTEDGVVNYDHNIIDEQRPLTENEILSISYDLAQLLLDGLWTAALDLVTE